MIIAETKFKENIVEYIIYMRQVQEIIRANDFDINKINKIIINNYDVSEIKKNEIRQWYSDLMINMKKEELDSKGDLSFIKEIITELNEIHKKLISDPEDFRHKELYRWAEPNIKEYRILSKYKEESETEICINALTSLLLLRLKQRAISDETAQAMQTFSNLLANLALHYHNKDIEIGVK